MRPWPGDPKRYGRPPFRCGQPYLTRFRPRGRVGSALRTPSPIPRIPRTWTVAACALTLAICASPAAASKQGPDLTVSKLVVHGSPVAGQSFTAALTVRNAGRRRAQASATSVVLSRDALGRRKVAALASRKAAKATLSVTVPAGTAAGRYRVVACADAGKRVKETNERN